MNVGIFIIGAVVTAMVLGALLLLFYGAVLDGRDEAGEPSPLPSPQPLNVTQFEAPRNEPQRLAG